MAVVIEHLETEEAAPAPAPAALPAAPREAPPDERSVLETLALEAWAAQRLMAD
jgi:hypothetical protein